MPDHQSVDPSAVLAAVGLPPPTDVVAMPGAEATVWRVVVDARPLALRLHRLDSTTAEREIVALQVARRVGLPVPELVVAGAWHDRSVAVTTWCPGHTVWELLRTTEGGEQAAVARRFGRAHAQLHASVLETGDMAELRAVGRAVPQVAAAGPPALLHLDFHPFNVLDDGSRVTGIVDWANTAVGDRCLDLARTRGLFASGVFAPDDAAGVEQAAELVAELWAQGYAEILPMPDERELAPFYVAAGDAMRADWVLVYGSGRGRRPHPHGDRRLDRPLGECTMTDLVEAHRLVLAGLGADGTRLGAGGEATVYALDDTRVVRIMHGAAGPLDDELTHVYQRWADLPGTARLGFDLPTVLDDATTHGVHWQILRRIPGVEVGRLLRDAPADRRGELLAGYLDASARIGAIDAAPTYGTLIGGHRDPTWADAYGHGWRSARPDCGRGWRRRSRRSTAWSGVSMPISASYDGFPQLVHVDYFPGNVLAADSPGGYRVTGVLDFASHALFGYLFLDVAGAVVMADLDTDVTPTERAALAARAVERCGGRLGDRLVEVMETYRVFYALYYSMDEGLIDWSARHLNDVAQGRSLRALTPGRAPYDDGRRRLCRASTQHRGRTRSCE